MSAYLTVQEVADRMRCEHRTVRRAIRSGELEAALIGGKWVIREEAVEAWFDARTACAEPPPARSRAARTPPRQADRPGSVARLQAINRGAAA